MAASGYENRPSNMKEIRASRKNLLEALQKNKKEHYSTFLKAQEIYRERVIEELDIMLNDARKGRQIRRAISLLEPEDHTSEYVSAITMLEMCEDETLMITSDDFRRLVMDEWGWKAAWLSNTSAYASQKQ